MIIVNEKGLTLVELLIVLVLSFIVSGLMYGLYRVQQVNTLTQAMVAETQQNIRAGVDIMTRELRMAGYDPEGTGNYTITAATGTSITFAADTCEDGGNPQNSNASSCGNTELFRLYVTNGSLRRTDGGAAIATGIQQIEFQYLDEDSNVIVAPVGTPNNIRSVQVSMLAQAPRGSRDYVNTQTYRTYSGNVWGPYNDNFRRRFSRKIIRLRNMGL